MLYYHSESIGYSASFDMRQACLLICDEPIFVQKCENLIFAHSRDLI